MSSDTAPGGAVVLIHDLSNVRGTFLVSLLAVHGLLGSIDGRAVDIVGAFLLELGNVAHFACLQQIERSAVCASGLARTLNT